MINEIFLYLGYGLIISSIVIYILLILVNRKRKISNSNGFDTVKEMLYDYDKINIILGSSRFSFYNIKRRVIKLSKNDYYGYDGSALSLGIMQAGISLVDDQSNKFIDSCRKIIPTLRILDLLGILVIIINYISVTSSDAKIGIVLVGIIMIIHYLYIEVLVKANDLIENGIKKIKELTDRDLVINFTKKMLLCNKIQFIAELVVIVRMVAIILGM